MILEKNVNGIAQFLEATIAGQLNTQEQIGFMRYAPFPDAKELAAVVKLLSKKQSQQICLPGAIDICGTGGSGLNRINTSTIAAFILAALDVGIAKHGNRASSGRFGSFDLLAELGIDFERAPELIESIYQKENLAFLYAPSFHNVMRHFAGVRKKIGTATFFNLLGPLLSPVNAQKQIIGTAFTDQMELIAETCRQLDKEQVFVVSGADGLDEVTLTGQTFVIEATRTGLGAFKVEPADFGIKPASFAEIAGGDAETNSQIALEIIEGKCETRHRDLVLINVALALKLAGKVNDLRAGYQMGLDAIQSGLVHKKYLTYQKAMRVPQILEKIIKKKTAEVSELQFADLARTNLEKSTRDFKAAISKPGLNLIAELKQRSPSNESICKFTYQPGKLARLYENCNVAAISVLTDQQFFGGEFGHLVAAAKSTRQTPLLCKDFILDKKQILHARANGADAILLIVGALGGDMMGELFQTARELKMDAIFEVHNEEELAEALAVGAEIIGINNRNLQSFEIDLRTTERLCQLMPPDKIVIAESGLASRSDIINLPERVNAILVGTSILASDSIPAKIAELLGRPPQLLKICGVKTLADIAACQDVDLIGFNFVPTSKRYLDTEQAKLLSREIKSAKTVGIFQNQNLAEINRIASELDLDYIQLHGEEPLELVRAVCRPVIKLVNKQNYQQYKSDVAFLLFDGTEPGSGKEITVGATADVSLPFLLAGGVNLQNAPSFLRDHRVIGLDIASGSETNGQKDPDQIQKLKNLLTSNR